MPLRTQDAIAPDLRFAFATSPESRLANGASGWHGQPVTERHLKRLMNEHVSHHYDDRTHLAWTNQLLAGREAAKGESTRSNVSCMPRLGGLHHRYDPTA